MGKYFGTDGFRGEANLGLTADHAYKIGRFLGWYYGQQKENGERARIVIGKDTRRSSYMFEYALVAGVTASGADAYMLHVTTTPSVAYVARVDGFDCGIMITASHNPFYDNGIKILNGKGENSKRASLPWSRHTSTARKNFPSQRAITSASRSITPREETVISLISSLWGCIPSRISRSAWTARMAPPGASQGRSLKRSGRRRMSSMRSRTG